MSLPKEIVPNPLVTSTIEIRYKSNLDTTELFPKVFSAFINDFPKIEQSKIPVDLRKNDPRFEYSSEQILVNEDYRLGVGSNVIQFEVASEYKLWNHFFDVVSKCLPKFFKIGHIDLITRIGIRYASVLDKSESIGQITNFPPFLNVPGYTEKFENLRTNLIVDDYNLFLQINEKANAKKEEKSITGVYIDIDASYTKNIPVSDEVLTIIDNLHSAQKKLFFTLLKEDYLATLNPKY